MTQNSQPQADGDESLSREPRERWERFLTMAQAGQSTTERSSIFYSPLTALWVVVPDSDAEHVPEHWFHVGR